MTNERQPARRFVDIPGRKSTSKILKPNVPWRVRKPAYIDGKFMTVRPLPDYIRPTAANTGGWQPGRLSPAPREYSAWVMAARAVRSYGDAQLTWITGLSSDQGAYTAYNQSPPDKVYEVLQEMQRRPEICPQPAWLTYAVKREGEFSARVKRPETIYLMRCLTLYENGSQVHVVNGLQPGTCPDILEITGSTGQRVLNLIDAMKPDGTFNIVDPTAMDSGCFITLFKGGSDPLVTMDQRFGSAASGGAAGTGAQGFGAHVGEYINSRGVAVGADYLRAQPAQAQNCLPANWVAQYADMLRGQMHDWDEMVWVPTHAEQMELLGECLPPDLIVYCFQDQPDLVPERIRQAAVASRTFAQPQGTGFAGHQYQMPMQHFSPQQAQPAANNWQQQQTYPQLQQNTVPQQAPTQPAPNELPPWAGGQTGPSVGHFGTPAQPEVPTVTADEPYQPPQQPQVMAGIPAPAVQPMAHLQTLQHAPSPGGWAATPQGPAAPSPAAQFFGANQPVTAPAQQTQPSQPAQAPQAPQGQTKRPGGFNFTN